MLPPSTFIIFGATGDLTKKKLIPALYHLMVDGKLDPKTVIIAIGRRDYTSEKIRKEFKPFIEKRVFKKKLWDSFKKKIIYHNLEFHDSVAYDSLKEKLELTDNRSKFNRIFYLATSPEAFPVIVKELNRTGIAERNPGKGWNRVVFEKPFGNDLRSARKLNKRITNLFNEKQIYRIDHYLGKGFVREIMVIRFANPIFEDMWNGRHIDSVEIVVNETAKVGARAGYYDTAGAMRDMIQNHLMQLLALTAMDCPETLSADHIRDEKMKVLGSVKKQSRRDLENNLVLGQYTAGTVEKKRVPSYRQEKNVGKNSVTETYVAVKLELKSARWRGVPFYLRTGKALKHHYAEIVIHFKKSNSKLFWGLHEGAGSNTLVIRIQPDQGLKFQFNLAIQAGDSLVTQRSMDYRHAADANWNTAEAYELLLEECIRGDQTLFTRWDFVEQSWKITDNLRQSAGHVHFYPAGSHGPAAALDMIKKDKRDWTGNSEVK